MKNDFKQGFEAERVASKLPALDLEARKIAGRIQGMRSQSKAGRGTEFRRFRPFENGRDNPRKIDFRASARMPDRDGKDRLLVREREKDIKKTYYLWCDFSRSMDYTSNDALYTKKEVAEILLMSSAYLAVYAGEQFTLLGSSMKHRSDKKSIKTLKNEMNFRHSSEEDLPQIPMHQGKKLKKNSHIFIFTDALSPPEEILQTIKKLFHAETKGHIIQILDRQEIDLDFSGRILFTDMENDTITVEKGKVEAIRSAYRKNFKAHQRALKSMVKNIPGWDFSTFVTDQPLHHALMPLYGISPHKQSATPKPPTPQ